MKVFNQTDLYNIYDKNRIISKKIATLLAGQSKSLLLNAKLREELNTIKKIRKETVLSKAVDSVANGQILLIKMTPEYTLPGFIPFIKVRKNGKPILYINVTPYVTEKKDQDSNDYDFSIDGRKAYILLTVGQIYLSSLDVNSGISPVVASESAILWAKMFNKILVKTLAINNNKERYEAFMYFAIRFFCTYIMELPEAITDSVALNYIENKKSYFIEEIETKIKDKELTPYKSFVDFCKMLFNNDITGIRTARVTMSQTNLNVSFYVSNFINLYGMNALLGLVSFPNFLVNIFSAFNNAGIVNDRSFEDIINDNKKAVPKIMSELYKNI